MRQNISVALNFFRDIIIIYLTYTSETRAINTKLGVLLDTAVSIDIKKP